MQPQLNPAFEYFNNISLQEYHTFKTPALAQHLFHIYSPEIFNTWFEQSFFDTPFLILGGGSNIYFTQNWNGNVIVMRNKAISTPDYQDDWVYISAGAGIIWDQWVQYSLNNHWYGLENLSLIPGCVGASPIQNIGAYGVEVQDFIHQVQYFDTQTGIFETLAAPDCLFGYRDSIFKRQLKKRAIITSVTFKLKTQNHKPVLTYAPLNQLQNTQSNPDEQTPTPWSVREIVVKTRQSKLPNPEQIPNAGSFFKNPVIPLYQFQELKAQYPNIVSFPVANSQQIKLSAAWLIEQAGWKGHQRKHVAVYPLQALVLTHDGNGNGSHLAELAQDIISDIQHKFGIQLEQEVNQI